MQPYRVIQDEHISRLLEIGVGSGLLTDALFENFSVDTLYLNDLYDNIQTNALPKDIDANYLIGDIGMIDLPKNLRWCDFIFCTAMDLSARCAI